MKKLTLRPDYTTWASDADEYTVFLLINLSREENRLGFHLQSSDFKELVIAVYARFNSPVYKREGVLFRADRRTIAKLLHFRVQVLFARHAFYVDSAHGCRREFLGFYLR